MKTKAVYVLISQETDYHLEMLLLSALSLRGHNPDMEIVVLTDIETRKKLTASLLPGRTAIVAVEVPGHYSSLQKSRYLKTRIRDFVDGSFLYLDTDTVICGSLDDLDSFADGVYMVSDYNGDVLMSDPKTLELCQKAGFYELERNPYFNGGVMIVSNNPEGRHFFDNWHRRWLESVEKGVSLDQPALCQANVDCGLVIHELPGIYNWQVMAGFIPHWEDAIILHYYGSPIALKLIPDHLRQFGADGMIQSIISASPFQLYSLFTIPEGKLNDYLVSDILGVYHNYPNYFHIVSRLARVFLKPYIKASAIKKRFLTE